MESKNVPPNYALVEMYSDGFIKVYGHKSLRCEIFNRPHCRTAKAAIVAEQLIDSILPVCYREIYYPSMVRASALLRKITPQQIQFVISQVSLLKAVGDMSQYRNVNQVVREYIRG